MIKRNLSIAAIAILAASAAIVTSCNKEDEVINDVPAMEMKNGELVPARWKFDPIHLWYRVIRQEDGTLTKVCEHWWYPWMTIFDLCGMVFGVDENNDMAVAHMETLDGRITRLVLQSDAMEPEIREIYNEFIKEGSITFSENCPIADPKIVEAVGVDHIPAGKYPICLEGTEIIITISE